MYDNKIRLSKDVIDKAELIAKEWGLKNARAAIEAVFRKYGEDYLRGRQVAPPERSAIEFSQISPELRSRLTRLQYLQQLEREAIQGASNPAVLTELDEFLDRAESANEFEGLGVK